MRRALRLLTAFGLTAAVAAPALAASARWRDDASPEDIRRLARLDAAWSQALKEAGASDAAGLKALGALADPDAALPSRPEPTPGVYRCRTVKLGSGGGETGLGLVAYSWFACKVALSPGGDLTFAKMTGSQRPMGHLYPESRSRLVYLGAVAWGNEGPAVYGRDSERDQVGVVERIGAQRWRLVLPFPKQESTLDILELRR